VRDAAAFVGYEHNVTKGVAHVESGGSPPLSLASELAPSRWARHASPNLRVCANNCSTSRQAGTAYSGGEPPHSTRSVVGRTDSQWRDFAKLVCRVRRGGPLRLVFFSSR